MKTNRNRIFAFCLSLCLFTTFALTGCSEEQPPYEYTYNRESAVAYAREYSTKRNPDYPEFSNNCTNFVSQCLIAGGMLLNEAPAADENNRITYSASTSQWFYGSLKISDEKPPNYIVSTSFVRTTDFVSYWVDTNGMDFSTYDNTFSGRTFLIKNASPGDVLLLYNESGEIVHLGMITTVTKDDVMFCANTVNRTDYSACGIDNSEYPKFGLIIF